VTLERGLHVFRLATAAWSRWRSGWKELSWIFSATCRLVRPIVGLISFVTR